METQKHRVPPKVPSPWGKLLQWKIGLRACTHLLGYGVPVQVALALVHALLVQELALVGNEQGVTHKFSHCSKKNMINIYN